MVYACLRLGCDEVFADPGALLKGKIHVRRDHGIAWKQTRKWLRVVGIHESLPDPGYLPLELKSDKIIIRRRRRKRRPLKDRVFTMGDTFARRKERLHEKIKRKDSLLMRKTLKTQIGEQSVYKSHISKSPKNPHSERAKQ